MQSMSQNFLLFHNICFMYSIHFTLFVELSEVSLREPKYIYREYLPIARMYNRVMCLRVSVYIVSNHWLFGVLPVKNLASGNLLLAKMNGKPCASLSELLPHPSMRQYRVHLLYQVTTVYLSA